MLKCREDLHSYFGIKAKMCEAPYMTQSTANPDLWIYLFNYTVKKSDKPVELQTKCYWIEHLKSSDILVLN
jgi:hypothetical protein